MSLAGDSINRSIFDDDEGIPLPPLSPANPEATPQLAPLPPRPLRNPDTALYESDGSAARGPSPGLTFSETTSESESAAEEWPLASEAHGTRESAIADCVGGGVSERVPEAANDALNELMLAAGTVHTPVGGGGGVPEAMTVPAKRDWSESLRASGDGGAAQAAGGAAMGHQAQNLMDRVGSTVPEIAAEPGATFQELSGPDSSAVAKSSADQPDTESTDASHVYESDQSEVLKGDSLAQGAAEISRESVGATAALLAQPVPLAGSMGIGEVAYEHDSSTSTQPDVLAQLLGSGSGVAASEPGADLLLGSSNAAAETGQETASSAKLSEEGGAFAGAATAATLPKSSAVSSEGEASAGMPGGADKDDAAMPETESPQMQQDTKGVAAASTATSGVSDAVDQVLSDLLVSQSSMAGEQ
jgi:hypothetical protein